MPNFQVTPQDITNAATSCNQTAETVSGQLATLKSYIVNLEAVWQGIAAGSFQELMQVYDACSARLTAALDEISSALTSTAFNYTTSEQDNVTSINNLESKLQGLQGANLG
jgi:WXG100 family type VII secretion target